MPTGGSPWGAAILYIFPIELTLLRSKQTLLCVLNPLQMQILFNVLYKLKKKIPKHVPFFYSFRILGQYIGLTKHIDIDNMVDPIGQHAQNFFWSPFLNCLSNFHAFFTSDLGKENVKVPFHSSRGNLGQNVQN